MLKIQFRDGRSDPVQLTPPGQTIGRGEANDIVIEAAGVRGFHADIKVEGEVATLTDVTGSGSTLLNGEPVAEPKILQPGDVIDIHGVELALMEAGERTADSAKTLIGGALPDARPGFWSLIAMTGPQQGKVFAVQKELRIGKALDSDLSIFEPGMSKNHAELCMVNGALMIHDLGSSNGTYLNGRRVEKSVCRDGDELQFERIKFIVKAPEH